MCIYIYSIEHGSIIRIIYFLSNIFDIPHQIFPLSLNDYNNYM